MQVKKCKILIVLDMIADMVSNKNVQPIETELFIRGRKVNISLVSLHNLTLLCQTYQTIFYALLYHENSKQTIQ